MFIRKLFHEGVEAPFLRVATFFLTLVGAVAVRISNYQEVFKPFSGHLNFLDPDSYYQLRRLVHFLGNFPSVMRFDPLLDWPDGSRIDWAPGLVWFLGLPLKLFGVSDFDALETGISFLVIGLGIVEILFLYFLIRRIIPDRRFWLFGLFLGAVLPSMVRYSCLGQVDHHIFEAIFPILGLYFIVRWFEKPQSLVWGVLLALILGLSLWTSAILLFLVLWAPIFVSLRAPKELSRKSILVAAVSFIVFCGLALHDVGSSRLFNISQTWMLLMATLLGSVLILGWRWSSQKKFFVLPLLFLGLFFTITAFIPQIQLWSMILAFKGYIFPASNVLNSVLEAQPLFGNWTAHDLQYVHGNYGYLFIPVAVFCLWGCFLKSIPALMRTAMIYALPFFILALAQKRLGTFLAPFVVMMISIFAWQICKLLAEKGIELAGAISALILALSFSPAFQNGFALSLVSMHAVDLPIERLFVEKLDIKKDQAWNRLVGKIPADSGIVAHPNLGHALTYLTGMPSTDNSFFHPRILERDLERRSFNESKVLMAKLKEQKVKYVLVADDILYHKFLWDVFKPEEKFPFASFQNQNGKLVRIWDVDLMEEKAWYRLLTRQELAKGFKFVFGLSVKNSGHFYENVKLIELEN